MFAIFNREVRSFFTSPAGYLIVGAFLGLTGLFLWVFKGEYNIFDHGFADLGNFFLLVPWIFIFLVPAVTMKSFSEERKMGTMELLLIKPISVWNLVLGKFWGAFFLGVMAILPTVVYVFAIAELGIIRGNYDLGVVLGSYFGLLFLLAAYTSIGLFSSTLSENQVLAFLGGVLICFALYRGFDAIATLFSDGDSIRFVGSLGAKAHFDSIARGVIDTRDLVYFLSLTLLFLYLTQQRIKKLPR